MHKLDRIGGICLLGGSSLYADTVSEVVGHEDPDRPSSTLEFAVDVKPDRSKMTSRILHV
jgi:hypothetical protein